MLSGFNQYLAQLQPEEEEKKEKRKGDNVMWFNGAVGRGADLTVLILGSTPCKKTSRSRKCVQHLSSRLFSTALANSKPSMPKRGTKSIYRL